MKRSAPKKITIAVPGEDGRPTMIKITVSHLAKVWAVHGDTVTHVPTGLRVRRCVDHPAAVRLFAHLCEKCPSWRSWASLGEVPPMDDLRDLLGIVRSLEG